MLLDELVGVIETLKQRIRTHGATLRANEIRTRVALIDPLLVALGWDVSDPALVTPEYAVGEGRADYALHGSESIPSAVVEAKRLGHALNDEERMQMLNYANARGVRCAAVTDGDVWECYEVFKQAPLEDRRLLNLRIVNRPAHELALQLLLLWRPNLASGQPVAANDPVVGFPPDQRRTTLQLSVPEASSVVEPPQPSPVSLLSVQGGWVSLAEFNPPPKTPAPKSIRFPDGTAKPVQKWMNLLIATGEWLESTGALATASKPILNGPREKVLDIGPSGFRVPTPIANTTLYLNTHGSADNLRRKTKALLEHCGVDTATVQLQVGE